MLGLRTTIYKVPNLHEAKLWYTEAFKVKPYFDELFYVGFNIGGYELGLLPEDGTITKGENILSFWGVENIEQVYNSLIKMGATNHEAPKNVGGEIMVATVYDPWKNIIGLIYNPEFKL